MNLLLLLSASFLLVTCLQCCKADITQFDASNLTEVQFTFRGTPGRDGRDGLVGPVGPQGGDGPVGPKGVSGPPGPPGKPGPPGTVGPTGAQGYTGPQGFTGPTGPEGPKGTRGVDGSPGLQGPRGLPGPPGITFLDTNAESRIMLQKVIDEVNSGLAKRLEREQKLGLSYDYPAEGCDEIARNNPRSSNGWYWVRDSKDNSTKKVYCYPCGHPTCGEGVWMRIGYFDMRGNLAECPKPLERFAVDTAWFCKRTATPCTSVHFSTLQKKYFSVCGKVEAYQFGSMDSFSHSTADKTPDDFYVEGISVTLGKSPRHHIWTYAVGLNANPDSEYKPHDQCPCTVAGSSRTRPAFLGNDFYCDSGNPSRNSYRFVRYTDRLWDNSGLSCVTGSTCCDNPDKPWFKKKLSQPANEDVELRWCGNEPTTHEATATLKVELYVHVE